LAAWLRARAAPGGAVSNVPPDPSPWIRVSARAPCPVCGHDSWCTVSPDGSAARCKRERSDHPSPGDDGEAWIHRLGPDAVHLPPPRSGNGSTRQSPPSRDWAAEQRGFVEACSELHRRDLARLLGVDVLAIDAFATGWCDDVRALDLRAVDEADPSGWTWAMHDGTGAVTGLRVRLRATGEKLAATGSRLGVVVPLKPSHGVLYVTEGESDAFALLTMLPNASVLATPGAGQCATIVAEYAKDREVVVLRDNDAAGRSGAQRIARACLPNARSVRIVEAPEPHKDLRNALRAGDIDAERFAVLVDHAERFGASTDDACATDDAGDAQQQRPAIEFLRPWQLAELPPRSFLWDDLLAEGELAMLFGPWGTCKSFLALALMVALADGLPFLGRDTKAGPALLVCGEGTSGITDRLRAAAGVARIADRTDPLQESLGISCAMPSLADSVGYDATMRAIEQRTAMPRLLAVDTWARACAAALLDENSSAEAGRLVAALDKMRTRFARMAQLIVHHSGNDRPDRARGSSVLMGAVDVIMRAELVRHPGRLPQIRLHVDKVKDGEKPGPFLIDFGEAVVRQDARGRDVKSLFVSAFSVDTETEAAPSEKGRKQTAFDRLRTALREQGRMTFADGKKAVTKADATVSEAFSKLVETRLARSRTDADGSKCWEWIGDAL
jgi:hypothetical protein